MVKRNSGFHAEGLTATGYAELSRGSRLVVLIDHLDVPEPGKFQQVCGWNRCGHKCTAPYPCE